MEYKDYYKTLGIDRNATQDEIKRTYRKLARKYHPDVSKVSDAEEKFKAVGEAYEVLKDPEKRAAYDQFGNNWKEGQGFTPPPNWDADYEFSGQGFSADQTSQFSDFFESLFGQATPGTGGYRQRPSSQGFDLRGEDHHAKIVILLEDSFHGATRSLDLKVPTLDQNGHLVNSIHTLNVTIPKGIQEGQRIRLAGQGGPGMGQGKHGDLYLEVHFNPHSLFKTKGKEVYHELNVAPWEAVLGQTVPVPTINGKVDLKLPPNTKNGQKMKLKGKGLPGKTNGDQIVTINIIQPPATSEEAKELYKQMAKIMPFNPRQKAGV